MKPSELPYNALIFKCHGEYACFSQLKTDRTTYPMPTPSALRGALESIYWKPNVGYRIQRVELLSEIQYVALKRNELKKGLKKADFKTNNSFIVNASRGNVSQRQTVALYRPRYQVLVEVHARPETRCPDRDKGPGAVKAIVEQLKRRTRKGQFFRHPYFGCKEFMAFFELVETDDDIETPINVDIDIGPMLYDVFDIGLPYSRKLEPSISIFNAEVQNGIMEIPRFESQDVFKLRGSETSSK